MQLLCIRISFARLTRSLSIAAAPQRLAVSGPNDRLPLNVLASGRPIDGFSDHMSVSSKPREQFAASTGAVREVEQLGSVLIDPFDDPLDGRLDEGRRLCPHDRV
jgi:hypothetical protein